MCPSTNGDDDKLGHDPLEWLSDDASSEDDSPLVDEPASAPQHDPSSHSEAEGSDDIVAAPARAAGQAFVLPEKLTVQHVEAIQQALMDHVGLEPDSALVTLDASQVSDMDSSGYQLLVSLYKHCMAHQWNLDIQAASEGFTNGLSAIGDRLLMPCCKDTERDA